MGMSPKFFILENKFYQYFDNFLLRVKFKTKLSQSVITTIKQCFRINVRFI